MELIIDVLAERADDGAEAAFGQGEGEAFGLGFADLFSTRRLALE